ncbi:hypothetical protein ACS5PN_11690 [Roseateles sp. NT4]|uniref:hypothetical protein n=1 Tax=Roseateles sp. NT4 TaxID=3453715 RepID=UPI003EE8F124
MKADVLWRVGPIQEQVFPVRHPTSPYFQRFRVSAFEKPVDEPKVRSDLHKRCINFLIRKVVERGLVVCTPTFDGEVRTADGQVLLDVAAGQYSWWSDTRGTRIPVGYGRYIQPDLCGRLATGDAFAPSMRWPSVIIEVIDTHYPEEGTLFELLKLSTQNHVVALHFIRASFSSYWSQLYTPEQEKVRLRVVHLLVNGNFVTNGEPLDEKLAPPADRKQFSAWYGAFRDNTFKRIMDRKDETKDYSAPA